MNTRTGMFSGMFGSGNKGGGNEGGNQSQSGGGNQNNNGDQNQNQDDQNAGGDDDDSGYGDLAALFAPEEAGDQNDQNNQNNQNNNNNQNNQNNQNEQTPEARLAEEIQNMIKGFKVTTEDLGEDFDPSDPQKLIGAMTTIQRKTAIATMQMAFKPMQAAMAQMAADVKQQIADSLAEFGSGSTAKATLEKVVPEVLDPDLTGLVNTLFEQSKKKAKGDHSAAAQMVRKALDSMGIKSKKSPGGGTGDPSEGASRREGKAALDLYAALPTRK